MLDYTEFDCDELVDAIQTNADQKAFEELMNRYSNTLFNLIFRFVSNRDDSKDILQTVWINIWNKRNSFLKEASFYTWAYRIARNESINFLNSKKRKNTLSLNEGIIEKNTSTFSYSPEETENFLRDALLILPEKQGIVFQLKYFEEKKYKEIAEILNLTEGALKTHYFLAVKKIEEYLKHLNHFE